MIHFGYGDSQKIDSLTIVWPNNTYQTLRDISVNQRLSISPENTKPSYDFGLALESEPLFKKVSQNLGIDYQHEEDNYTDFNRQKLIPYQLSDRGPAVAIGDVNNDGKEDIYFGSSKFKPSKLFIQTDTAYVEKRTPFFAKASIWGVSIGLSKSIS